MEQPVVCAGRTAGQGAKPTPGPAPRRLPCCAAGSPGTGRTGPVLSTAGSLLLLALARGTAGPKFRRIHPLVLFPLLFQLEAGDSASQLSCSAAFCCSRVPGPRQLQGLHRAYFSAFPSIRFPLQVGSGELVVHGPKCKKVVAWELATSELGGTLSAQYREINCGLF